MGCSSSQTAPAWVLPMGCSPSGTGCSSMGAPWGHSLLQASTCSRVESLPQAVGWISAPLWTSMDCRGTTCLTMVFTTICKGRLSVPTFGHLLPPSFFTDLGVCRVVSLPLSHSSLYTAVSPPSFFLPFLKCVITEVLPPSLIGLALASGGSILEPAGTGFIRHGGSFLQKPPL